MLRRWKSVFRRFEISLHWPTAEDERALILWNVGNSQPVTACHIPEAFNPLPPKRWYLFTQIISVTSQMTVILILLLIFTGVRTSNLDSMGILFHKVTLDDTHGHTLEYQSQHYAQCISFYKSKHIYSSKQRLSEQVRSLRLVFRVQSLSTNTNTRAVTGLLSGSYYRSNDNLWICYYVWNFTQKQKVLYRTIPTLMYIRIQKFTSVA